MTRFSGQLQTPQIVFELSADMAELDQWNPNVRTSERVSGERLGPGSHYVSTIACGPMRMTAMSELVLVQPGHEVQYEGSIASFWSLDSLTFEATDEGTRITFHNETTTPKVLRPLIPLLNAVFQRQALKAVEGAREHFARMAE